MQALCTIRNLEIEEEHTETVSVPIKRHKQSNNSISISTISLLVQCTVYNVQCTIQCKMSDIHCTHCCMKVE